MYLIWEICIGILAGFLAGKIMRGRGYGVLMDLVLGLVGALLGGLVFGLLGLHGYGVVGQLVIATSSGRTKATRASQPRIPPLLLARRYA